jgi:hypothetical protein
VLGSVEKSHDGFFQHADCHASTPRIAFDPSPRAMRNGKHSLDIDGKIRLIWTVGRFDQTPARRI